ncbi:hypothetical protein P4U05_18445 [Bacillus paranthracis]|nr:MULTISPECIES: hypothetical protein [Bacillus cereus group]ADY24924.1 hypothetical protein YBT020_28851 [Bacillus thuringiensis serovar finitimus YBT-020]MEC3360847.1 hypothetical protein [Bacillus paranthracis]MED0786444.1 hypothetical protein [Bacillus paranthracis]MED0811419.1 hypothetical protein [Bacillus paranthracis]MED0815839.1 hypothetical protein [Bacillus paranthracis]
MKKLIYGLLSVMTVFVLIKADTDVKHESKLSYEKIIQYSEGHTGG